MYSSFLILLLTIYYTQAACPVTTEAPLASTTADLPTFQRPKTRTTTPRTTGFTCLNDWFQIEERCFMGFGISLYNYTDAVNQCKPSSLVPGYLRSSFTKPKLLGPEHAIYSNGSSNYNLMQYMDVNGLEAVFIDQYLLPDYEWTSIYDSIPTPQWCSGYPVDSLKCLVFTVDGCMKNVNCSIPYGVVCEKFLDFSGIFVPNANSFHINAING